MKKKITENKIKLIIEDRLSLQSTKRALEIYRLPKISLNYFESGEFISNYFSKWDELKKQSFLKTLGGQYWQTVKNILDRTKE